MTKRESPIMVADGPWDSPTVYALRHVPSGQPLSPKLAEAIRASARRARKSAPDQTTGKKPSDGSR